MMQHQLLGRFVTELVLTGLGREISPAELAIVVPLWCCVAETTINGGEPLACASPDRLARLAGLDVAAAMKALALLQVRGLIFLDAFAFSPSEPHFFVLKFPAAAAAAGKEASASKGGGL